jgi:UDP:flavonoid glycosyltransferase YjiC (YdhE family)
LTQSPNFPITKIAYFISPHGFGHAARAAAVMNALDRQHPKIHFEVFSLVPRWFFSESLTAPFTYHSLLTDIGLAQESSLKENVPQTLQRLRAFLPFDPALVADLARRIGKCNLVICDIAPLGIAVAQQAGVPAILIENFTWDWIYAGYAEARFTPHIDYLRAIFRSADYHIQTEPVCARWRADLTTPPVSRAPRTSRNETRKRLGIAAPSKVVLITMGGIPEQHSFLDRLVEFKHVRFIIPGATKIARRRDNLILLPHRSEFYHPDLMNAADAVIGKAGYSTVAEAYHAGIPFGFVSREKFREAGTMARFIKQQMQGVEISADDFQNGRWLHMLDELLAMPRIKHKNANGAEQVADFILNRAMATNRKM